MPVAKSSHNFYEKFGEEATEELVNCLNTIESSYRLELRDLFDAHFGRFEAKMEQRLEATAGQLRRECHREIVSLTRWNIAVWVPVTLAVIGLYFKP